MPTRNLPRWPGRSEERPRCDERLCEPTTPDAVIERLRHEAEIARHAAVAARREAELLVPMRRRIAALEAELAAAAAAPATGGDFALARLRARERELDRREAELEARAARLERLGIDVRDRAAALTRAEQGLPR